MGQRIVTAMAQARRQRQARSAHAEYPMVPLRVAARANALVAAEAAAPRRQASRHRRQPAILPRMTSRDSAASEITPEVLLHAYACGIFDGRERRRSNIVLGQPEMRSVIPLDGFRVRRGGTHGSLRRLHGHRQQSLQGRDAGSPRRRPAGATPGSTSASAISMLGCTNSDIATASRSGTTASLPAACTASASAGPSSARACFTPRVTPRKWRWCIWWRG